MFKKRRQKEKTGKNLKRGLFSLQRGLESIATTFAKTTASNVNLGTEITSLRIGSEKNWSIHGMDLQSSALIKEYDAVILALPPKGFIELLSKSPAVFINQEVLQPISDLQTSSLTLICVGMKKNGNVSDDTLPKGFGFLLENHLETPLLGCVFDSELFPEADGKIRVTFMLQGEVEEQKAKQIALEALRNILSISDEPDFMKVHLCKNCIPQYPVGYKADWDAFLSNLSSCRGFICSSTAGDGVSLEDCARKGYFAAQEISRLFQGAATSGCVTERSGSPKT